MTELWLVRHGQTDWNLAGRWQGQSPEAPGLNDVGRAQVSACREQLLITKPALIYSSDALRSLQTAEILAQPLGLHILTDPRLREINLGVWEGMFLGDIKTQYPLELLERERNPLHARAPGGESLAEMAYRVLEAVNEIAAKHKGESIFIVSHGLSLAVVISQIEGYPLETVYEHIPVNAKPYCVHWH